MIPLTRREMITTAGSMAVACALPGLAIANADAPLFTLPKLPYAFDALEPHIDAKTMEIHHDKHHQAYVDNLNKALAGTDWLGKKLEEILTSLDKLPMAMKMAVRNNGGGHYNHSLFWQMLSPKSGKPGGALNEAIAKSFVDMVGMLKKFKEAAMTRFGSGWAWLVVGQDGTLKINSSPNQDSPIMDGSGVPILGLDVWEHAYYLKYQNKRADYVEAFFKVINWDLVTERYQAAIKKG